MTSYQLLTTIFNVTISGGVQENFNGKPYGLSDAYSLNASFSDGTGKQKAQLATATGSLQLTAVANPSAAPGLATAASGGSIAAGTYALEFTYYNASGETIGSATAQITTTGSSSTITVTAAALPSGATGVNVYLTAGGAGTGKVGTAASNVVVLTALTTTGLLPSSTLSSATIAGQIDLMAVPSAGKTFDFSGTDDGNGAGGAGGVKIFWIEQTDSSPGQILSFLAPSGVWTNGMGTTPAPLGTTPSATGFLDAMGRVVDAGNHLVKVQAKYNVPIIKYVAVGEGSWF